MAGVAETTTGIGGLGGNQNTAAAPSRTSSISTPQAPDSVSSPASSTPNGRGVGNNLGTATASATPAPVAGKSGTNAGVIAGAAVGAAIGAAFLTFLITFMFLRKRNQRDQRRGNHRSDRGGLSTHTEKALPKDPSQGPISQPAAPTWEKHLPQSADDKTIRSTVKTLFDQVELHVENFYRDAAVPMSENLQAELLRVDSPHLPEPIVALLPRARSQIALIKHCLLSYIVASISTDDNSVQSLLPADYATLPHLARASGQKKPGKYRAHHSPTLFN